MKTQIILLASLCIILHAAQVDARTCAEVVNGLGKASVSNSEHFEWIRSKLQEYDPSLSADAVTKANLAVQLHPYFSGIPARSAREVARLLDAKHAALNALKQVALRPGEIFDVLGEARNIENIARAGLWAYGRQIHILSEMTHMSLAELALAHEPGGTMTSQTWTVGVPVGEVGMFSSIRIPINHDMTSGFLERQANEINRVAMLGGDRTEAFNSLKPSKEQLNEINGRMLRLNTITASESTAMGTLFRNLHWIRADRARTEGRLSHRRHHNPEGIKRDAVDAAHILQFIGSVFGRPVSQTEFNLTARSLSRFDDHSIAFELVPGESLAAANRSFEQKQYARRVTEAVQQLANRAIDTTIRLHVEAGRVDLTKMDSTFKADLYASMRLVSRLATFLDTHAQRGNGYYSTEQQRSWTIEELSQTIALAESVISRLQSRGAN